MVFGRTYGRAEASRVRLAAWGTWACSRLDRPPVRGVSVIYGNSFSVFRFPRDVPALFSLRNIGRFAGVILTPPGGKAALVLCRSDWVRAASGISAVLVRRRCWVDCFDLLCCFFSLLVRGSLVVNHVGGS